MSSNRLQYRIYADDQNQHTHEEWAFADRHINGMVYSCDKNEAFALAKKAAKNCQFPFVVLAVPIPRRDKEKLCTAWIVSS